MALNDGSMIVVFWEYRPSDSAAYAFLALFALATLAHLVYFCWLRAWSFIPFLLGGVCNTRLPPGEVFGYYERSLAHSSPTILDPWILQNMLLLVAPPLLAATVYMSYGRIVQALHSEARRSRRAEGRGCCAACCLAYCSCSATRVYVLFDVIAILTQLIGTVLPASGAPQAVTESKIVVLAGLAAQMAALAVFIVTCARMHVRLRDEPTRVMMRGRDVNWLWYFVVLEVAAVMLVVRSVVRGIEFAGGTDGFVASHEVFIYVFDAVPMLAVMVGMVLLHPGRLVREAARLEKDMRLDQALGRSNSTTELRAMTRV